MHWKIFWLASFFLIQQRTQADYLTSFAAELLAPAVGADDFLWLGFVTSYDSQFTDEARGSYHILIIEEIRNGISITPGSGNFDFGRCASLRELTASTITGAVDTSAWPRPVACNGGQFEFDGRFKPGTRYQMVLRMLVLASALLGDTSPVKLRLHIGYAAVVPVVSRANVSVFESSSSDVSPEQTSIGILPQAAVGEGCTVRELRLMFPKTFVPTNTSVTARFTLISVPSVVGAKCTVFVFAQPFTLWSLQPVAQLATSIQSIEAGASCADQVRSDALPAQCFWVSLGAGANDMRLHANGFKMVFDDAHLLPAQMDISLTTTTPSTGSFEQWLATSISGVPGSSLSRTTIYSDVGLSVFPAPEMQILSYSDRTVAAMNVVRIRVVPGVTIHGTVEPDRSTMGFIKLVLPAESGQVADCSLQPRSVWDSLPYSYDVRLRSRPDTWEGGCFFYTYTPSVHLFDRVEYFVEFSYYNSIMVSRAKDSLWKLQVVAAGALSMPKGTTHTTWWEQTFDVVASFSVFRVVLSRLTVTPVDGTVRIETSATVWLQLGVDNLASTDVRISCLRMRVPVGFNFSLGSADTSSSSDCHGFQALVGLSHDTRCVVEQSNVIHLNLGGATLQPKGYYAFSLSMMGPSARSALGGADVEAWDLDALYGSGGECSGQTYAARQGHSSSTWLAPAPFFPYESFVTFISASSYIIDVEAAVTVHFSLAAPLDRGGFVLVSAPRDFEWRLGGTVEVQTSRSATGAAASWFLWEFPQPTPVSVGEYPNELLLKVGGGGIQAMVGYGTTATLQHPPNQIEYFQSGRAEPRSWVLETFYTISGDLPEDGYRESPTTHLPFRYRVAAGTSVGYNLLGLVGCKVSPWDNRMRQITSVRVQFTASVSMVSSASAPVCLKVEPPVTFIFRTPCQVTKLKSIATQGLAQEVLEVSDCIAAWRNRFVILPIAQSVVAGTSYSVELRDLEMPSETPALENKWSLSLTYDCSATSVPSGAPSFASVDVAFCEDVQGFMVANPLPRASMHLHGSATSFRPLTRSSLHIRFSVPEPSLSDYKIVLVGPIGAKFESDCLPDMQTSMVAFPLASAALPGRIVTCQGSGGLLPDRARAVLLVYGAEGGGLLPAEVYSLTFDFTNGPYLGDLEDAMEFNGWRLQVADALWSVPEAVFADLYAYDLKPPIRLSFLVSDKVSYDPQSILVENFANVTVQIGLMEAFPSEIEIILRAPSDSFQFREPCRLSHTDQLDWAPAVDVLPLGAQPPRPGSKLSSTVYTVNCVPSCVSLADPRVLSRCQVSSPTQLNLTINFSLQASTPYCFAVEMRSPSLPFNGAGLWALEFWKDGVVIDRASPTAGPEAGATLVPSQVRGLLPKQDMPFMVSPSTRARAATIATLRVVFTLPVQLDMGGVITFVTPVVGGSFSASVLAMASADIVPSTTRSSSWEENETNGVVKARGTGVGRFGVPFFDFSNACSVLTAQFANGIGCAADKYSLTLSIADDSWHSYREYRFALEGVPAGSATGAADLFSGEEVPPFHLFAFAPRADIVAAGTAPGWRWTPELSITRLAMQPPLRELPAGTTATLELGLTLSSPIQGRPARLRVGPPSFFRFEWRSGLLPELVAAAGDGPNCDENPLVLDLGAQKIISAIAFPDATPCRAIKCGVSVAREDGSIVDIPQCRASDIWSGCCYGSGKTGEPAFVQLLLSPNSTALSARTRIQVIFWETATEMIASDGVKQVDSWNFTTEIWKPTICSSGTINSTEERNARCSAAAEVTFAMPGRYELLDQSSDMHKIQLFTGFVQALVEPLYTTVSYDANPITIVFELTETLPRFGVTLRVVAPPGFVFTSSELSPVISETLSPRLIQALGGRALQPLPDGVVVMPNGPVLGLRLFSRTGGSLSAYTIYGFRVLVNNPHIRPVGEENNWVMQAFLNSNRTDQNGLSASAGEGSLVPLNWGVAVGFVLQGSVTQFSIIPSTALPLHPTNVIVLTFVLSSPLPRADYSSMEEWSQEGRASRVIISPPEGFYFPVDCEAPPSSDVFASSTPTSVSSTTSVVQQSELAAAMALPSPYHCVGVMDGFRSNATLILLPTDDPHSGMLTQDQLYGVSLVVRNPLSGPTAAEDNRWRLSTSWGETTGSFLTLHDEYVAGFEISGMSARVLPGSIQAGVFHTLNITFTPRASQSPEAGTDQLSAILLVAPRGAVLTCANFVLGSAGGGSGNFGWIDAERVACSESDSKPETGSCATTGVPLPRGLWTLCLTYARRPFWPIVPVDPPSKPLIWFAIGVINPVYLPKDNVWRLLILGKPADNSMVAGPLIDVASMGGYTLQKR